MVAVSSDSIFFVSFCFLMIRRPPSSTRTDTLFPYTTLFRSRSALPSTVSVATASVFAMPVVRPAVLALPPVFTHHLAPGISAWLRDYPFDDAAFAAHQDLPAPRLTRSEERRVGKECVSTCRSRWSPYPSKQNSTYTIISIQIQ